MGLRFTFTDLYRAPEINPVNRKARAVPMLNPINQYGRVFFFSWFGFMVAFWAWYSKFTYNPSFWERQHDCTLLLSTHQRPQFGQMKSGKC